MPVESNPYDAEDKAWERSNQKDPWVLYLIARESLNMGVGKVGAQCGHAVGMIYEKYMLIVLKCSAVYPSEEIEPTVEEQQLVSAFSNWKSESYRKVVLRADDKEWEKIKQELNCFVVKDAGLTEVTPGSETVMALWPMKKSTAPKAIQRLQVLK